MAPHGPRVSWSQPLMPTPPHPRPLGSAWPPRGLEVRGAPTLWKGEGREGGGEREEEEEEGPDRSGEEAALP